VLFCVAHELYHHREFVGEIERLADPAERGRPPTRTRARPSFRRDAILRRIDGGQSGTAAVVATERGNVLGRGDAGPADEVGESPASTRLREAVEASLGAALAAANLPHDTRS